MTTRLEDWLGLTQQMPPSVRGAVSTELWRRDLLWALDLPVELVPVASLAWLLDVPCWQVGGVPFQVTPNAVRADPVRYCEQYQRTLATDVAYSIHLVKLNGRWTVLDGLHRLLKAAMLGWEDIPAKKLSAEDYHRILDRPGATSWPD